jgi:hypothetical protein
VFYITQKNWDKILGYADEAYGTEKSEIGGMSVMVEDKDGDWILQEPVILKQEISSGNTVLDKDALAEYYTKQAIKMKKKNFRFCWWHSHHTMSAFWSGTDKTAIDEFDEGDFSFALVVNLKGEYKFRVSIWKPFAVHEDTDLEILDVKNRCNKKMKEEVKELCSKPSSDYSSWRKDKNNYGYNYGSYSYKSTDQLIKEAAEDPRQERLPFRTTAGRITSYGDDVRKTFSEIVEDIDATNSELIDGTIDYKDYVKALDELNDELKEEKSLYKVLIINEKDVQNLLHILPSQLLRYAHSGDEVYDASFYDADYGWNL